jgi:hypothetical protein
MTKLRDEVQLKHFLDKQIDEINRSKWIESEKARRDLGKDSAGQETGTFYISWIKDHATEFRSAWDKSCCKNCQSYGCTAEPKINCPNHVDSLRIRIIKSHPDLVDFEIIDIDKKNVMGRYYLIPSHDKNGDIDPRILTHGASRPVEHPVKNLIKEIELMIYGRLIKRTRKT